jgi:hypothetical protein
MMTGRKASTGPARPASGPPQPHWKTATSTPKEAAAATRFITAAVSGTSSERNAKSSSTKPSAMITPTNSGSLPYSTVEKSSNTAVWPPTYARMVLPRSAAGTTSSRRWSIRSEVALSCGEVVGTASTRATFALPAVGSCAA